MFGKKSTIGDRGIYLIQDAVSTFQGIAENLEEGAANCEMEVQEHKQTIRDSEDRIDHLTRHVVSARNFAGNIKNLINTTQG